MSSEDEDADNIQVPGAYCDSPTQESQEIWAPVSYLAGLFPRLSTFISLTINLGRVQRNHFQASSFNGLIADVDNGGQVTAYSQETCVQPATPRSVPESTSAPNPRAEYEIYYDQLLLRKRGCPLYCPGPIGELPLQYRKTGCRIGDIGILYSDGSFDYLFNILYPAYHPINRGRVPPGFAPAVIRRDVAAGQAVDAGNVLANSCMRERNSTDVGTRISFSKLKSHARQWYSYILEERGRRGVRNGDVRLIIGFDKAPSWGIATRACSQKPGLFGLRKLALSGSFEAAWYCPEGIGNGKFGPWEDETKDLRKVTDPPVENQTLFIRSMNFTLAGEISDCHDLAALRVQPSSLRTEGPSDSFQGNPSLSPALSSNHSSSSSVGGPQVGHQRNVIFSLAHFELPVVHPSTHLNQLLLNKFPNAKIAITDDWDWISVIREDDLVFPTPNDLCQRILESCNVSEENGIATILRSTTSIGDDLSLVQDHVLPVDDPTVSYLRDEALSSLRIQCAFSALVDSVERIPPPRCAPCTRQAITLRIEEWVKNTSINDRSEIFWLTGGAGAGKSAVAQSVAEVFKQENILAASFFFNSASNLTNNGASLIPTLVFQLLEVLPGLKSVVEDCINSDRDLLSNLLDVQNVTQKLFIEPLNILHLAKPDHSYPLLMVIDGLDECHDTEFQCKFLRIITKAILEVPYSFRLLISSRSEDHLVKNFDHDAALQMITVHRYNLSDDPDADCDIYDFFEQQLEEIKCTHPFRAHLPTGWPGEEVLVTLVDMSSQHFIYASTVVEYIQSPKHKPEERLRIVLGLSPPAAKLDRPFFQLDFLYSSMFQALGKDHLRDLHSVLGLRHVIDDSSSANDGLFQWQSGSKFLFFAGSPNPGYRTPLYIIETLLKIRPGDLEPVLSPLRSLVSLDDCDVRVLHKSLFDYLLDSSRSGDFHLKISVPHRIVTKYIVENWVSFQNHPFTGPTLLTNILAYHTKASGLDIEHISSLISSKADLSNFELPSIGSPKFDLRIPIPLSTIPDPTPKFDSSIPLPAIPDPSPKFDKRIPLPPIPDLSPKSDNRIPLSSPHLHIHASNKSRSPISQHIYKAVQPTKPVPSQTEGNKPPEYDPLSQTECDKQWSVKHNPDVGPLSMTFVRAFVYDAKVHSVRFSPNGHHLTIGLAKGLNPRAGNGKVITYNVVSGNSTPVTCQKATQRNTDVRSVCFSPDGCYCAIGDSRGTIMVWEIAKNFIRNTFVGHSGAVTCLDYSSNGRLLVSASLDGSIRIWNIRDGFANVLIKNTFCFFSVKFSPDMRYVAAANIDKMLRIWDVRTGRLVDWWIGNTSAVNIIAFTPDCKGLVSGSWDSTVDCWDLRSLELCRVEAPTDRQREVLTFSGHNDQVFSVAVSPDGHWVLTGSRDGSTSIWDIYDGTQRCTLQGNEGDIISVDFSPAGNYLAVGSVNGIVSLWKYEQVEH